MKHRATRAFEQSRETHSAVCPGRHCLGAHFPVAHRYTSVASHPDTPRHEVVVADAASDDWLLK